MNEANPDAIEIDNDQYPVAGAANAVEQWPYQEMDALFEHLESIWPYYGRFEKRADGTWEIATGGWSGCEELIDALMSNMMIRACAWQLSKRGGYYEFKVPEHRATT